MKIGTAIAIVGIWLGTGMAMFSGNAESGIFIASTMATVFIACFSN